MKTFNRVFLPLLFSTIYSITLFAQHYAGPIDSCLDVYDGMQNGYTEYLHFSVDNNNNDNDIQRYYRVVYTHPGCDTTSYKTVFFEGFDGTSLDTTRWSTSDNCPYPLNLIGCNGCAGEGDEPDKLWLSSNVTVSSGYLRLKTAKVDPPSIFTCVNKAGDTIQVERSFSSAMIVSKNLYPNGFGGGCFKRGRISVRAKIPNDVQNTLGAYWFYGWAGEVDVIEVCQPECDEMQTNRHLWSQNPTEPCDTVSDNMAWAEDHNIGNINTFHTYTMEWTPYMINISVDGTSKRTFWRFHEWDGDPLTCQEFQAGTTDTLWQHMLWYTLYNHYMNLILNLGIKELTNTSSYGGEMLVDWIKVEQQVPFSSVQRLNPGPNPNYICQGETAQFQFTYAPGPYPVTEWTVSPNLQVLDVTHNPEVVTVKALTIYNGPGWVQARYWNPNSCFGSNTRLNVDVVGLPISPQISAYKTCSFISLKVDNASSANTYQWEILTPGYTGYPFSNGNGFNINMPSIPPPYPVTIAYRVLVTNLCGTTTYIGTVTTLPCNSWHLNVYPNPANTYINFELVNFTQSDLNQGLELTLIDANFSIKKTVPVTQLTQYMDVSDVEPGYHYAYVVVNGENVISNQFVIQH